MKKLSLVCFILIILALFVSCATLSSEPTLVGQWKLADEEITYTYTFTKDGYYVLDIYDSYYNEHSYSFGEYETDEVCNIYGDFGNFTYWFDGNKLYLDDVAYKRISRQAVNNTRKLPGVWQNDSHLIGFATDGLVISQGSYRNLGSYEVEDDEITISGRDSDFIIINDNLYINDFRFLGCHETIQLSRVSSGGINRSNKSTLCNPEGWFYQNLGRSDVAGTYYIFYQNGNFDAYDISNGQLESSFSGTYTYNDNRVHLSNGDTPVFGFIDNTPFGY